MVTPIETVGTKFIATTLDLAHDTVRDKLVKSPGFPAPCYNGKKKRWFLRDFHEWLLTNQAEVTK